eukprot:1032764_1
MQLTAPSTSAVERTSVLMRLSQLSKMPIYRKPATDTTVKAVSTFCAPIFILLIFKFNENISGYRIVSYLMMLFFIKFFSELIYFMSTATAIYSVKILTQNLDGFGHISFPLEIEKHPSECIMSISELCAIRGSSVHKLLYSMTTTVGTLLFCAIGFKWHELDDKVLVDATHLSLIFGLITAFGIVGVGVWELNAQSSFHIFMHYGSCVGLMAAPIAVMIQLNYSIISFVILAANMGSWSTYALLTTFRYQKRYENDFEKVHNVTRMCIVLETIAWFVLAFTITFFAYNLY